LNHLLLIPRRHPRERALSRVCFGESLFLEYIKGKEKRERARVVGKKV